MAKRILITQETVSISISDSPVPHLDSEQVNRLTRAFRLWYDTAPSEYIRKVRGRYWIGYLVLRFTGARLGEVLRLTDPDDIDFDRSEVRIAVEMDLESSHAQRSIPVPPEVIGEIVAYANRYPGMRGKVFALDQGNFRREFYRRAEEAALPRELSHPHILRHTRAIELLKAGVPLTTVQALLGHALSSTTAVYLQRSEVTIRKVLEEKGFL